MSNKQQTAVEWLYNELFYFLNAKSKFEDADEILERAKEMEKEKLEDAWVEGFKNWNPSKSFEQYYNETYGSNK
jgi:hypothetical protein